MRDLQETATWTSLEWCKNGVCQFSRPNCGTVACGCGKISLLPIKFERHGVAS